MFGIINFLFFLAGIFSTMIAFKINIYGLNLYIIYNIIVIIIILMLIQQKCKLKLFRGKLITFYYFIVISCMLSVFYINSNSAFSKTITYAIQVMFIWIVLLTLLYNSTYYNYYKDKFIQGFKLSILIQAIWGAVELIVWYLFNFKLNDFVFGDLLKIKATHEFTSFTYVNDMFYIRPNGINWEPAYFGILLLIGFFITEKLWLKGFYLILILISLSRTSIFGLILVLLYIFVKNIKNRKFLIRIIFAMALTTSLLVIVMMSSESIRDRVNSMIFRSNISNSDINKDGTDRHILYYPLSIDIMFSKSNLLQMFLGYGPRISGYPFQKYSSIASKLNINLFSDDWSVESDVVDILIGNGIIGFFIYYNMIFSNINNLKNSKLMVCNLILLFCGITYGFYSLTFFNLLLIFSDIDRTRLKNTDAAKVSEFKKIDKRFIFS